MKFPHSSAGVTDGSVSEGQIAAFAMAVYLQFDGNQMKPSH